jgi:hypothetical protein
LRASDEPAQESQQQLAPAPAADARRESSEQAAVHDMTRGNHDAHASHMTMTEMRQAATGDTQRANEIVEQLCSGIEKYKDYHVALADGFHIFLPNVRSRKSFHQLPQRLSPGVLLRPGTADIAAV